MCGLQTGWFVSEKCASGGVLLRSRGEEGGRGPRQGDSGIFSGCPEQGMPSLCMQADVKASSLQ